MADVDQDLNELRSSLLKDRPRHLGPEEGEEAFRQHILLASLVHRATRLDRYGSESETDAWVRYLTSYFPPGRNTPEDARLLFGDWRTSLLKDNAPGARVPITHGQSVAHWQRDSHARLCINLEDMWVDFEFSVNRFVSALRTDQARRTVVLDRFRAKTWDISVFAPDPASWAGATVMDLTLVPGISASSWPPSEV